MAVEIKRVAGIEAVEQLTRYLERIRLDPAFEVCRGVLVAQTIKPQARVLASARGHRVRRGRPRAAAGRARAGSEIVRCVNDQHDAVLTERRGRVLLITINRPDQRNAVNAAVAHGIAAALDELDGDSGAVASACCSAPARGFCAGMDLKAFVAGERAVRRGPRLRRHHPARGRQAADRRGRGIRAGRRARDRARVRPDRRRPRRPARDPRGQALAGRRWRGLLAASPRRCRAPSRWRWR